MAPPIAKARSIQDSPATACSIAIRGGPVLEVDQASSFRCRLTIKFGTGFKTSLGVRIKLVSVSDTLALS